MTCSQKEVHQITDLSKLAIRQKRLSLDHYKLQAVIAQVVYCPREITHARTSELFLLEISIPVETIGSTELL